MVLHAKEAARISCRLPYQHPFGSFTFIDTIFEFKWSNDNKDRSIRKISVYCLYKVMEDQKIKFVPEVYELFSFLLQF